MRTLLWSCSLAGVVLRVAGNDLEVVDPNPALVNDSGHVIAAMTVGEVDRFVGNLPARAGVVADGVSQLVLRIRTSNAVTFSLSPRLGQLCDLSGSSVCGGTITVPPVSASDGVMWAFARYVAPDDLPAASIHREIAVTAREPGRTSIVRWQIQNPPVLLVHGLWSSSTAWDGLKSFLKDKRFLICEGADCTVNFGATQPAPSFEPFAADPENQFAINHLIEKTTNTLNRVRSNGLAAAQVDLVAHSLGGLIARARMAVPDMERAYRRRDNFQRGDFHKLITIGTPHRGTPAADFLISNRCVTSTFFNNMTLEQYMASIEFPFGRAVEELRTVSATLTNIGATADLPAHAIVGIAPRKSGTEGVLGALPRALGSSRTLDEILGGNGRHDTIVPRESQAGGLPRTAVTFTRGIVHSDVASSDVSETEARSVWRRVARLLRTPSTSKSFGNFTALVTNTAPATPPCE